MREIYATAAKLPEAERAEFTRITGDLRWTLANCTHPTAAALAFALVGAELERMWTDKLQGVQ